MPRPARPDLIKVSSPDRPDGRPIRLPPPSPARRRTSTRRRAVVIRRATSRRRRRYPHGDGSAPRHGGRVPSPVRRSAPRPWSRRSSPAVRRAGPSPSTSRRRPQRAGSCSSTGRRSSPDAGRHRGGPVRRPHHHLRVPPGKIGDAFRDLLVRKVREGVAVRPSSTAATASRASAHDTCIGRCRDGGVEVVVNQGAFLDLDGPLGHRRIDWRFDDLGHFDHRKAVVIDGRIAFGAARASRTTTPTSLPRRDASPRGTRRRPGPGGVPALVVVPGGSPAGDARRAGPVLPGPLTGDGIAVDVLHNVPGARSPAHRDRPPRSDRGASRRLSLINPYLADQAIIRGIRDAGLRGVDVRVIVPADSLSFVVRGAVRHWFPVLRDAGVDVREYPRMAHAKVARRRRHRAGRVGEPRCAQPPAQLGDHVAGDRPGAGRPRHARAVRSRPRRVRPRPPATARRTRMLDAAMSALSPLF